MTVVAIHQPQFLPWLGYFDKLDRCDVYCLLDTVQYKKNEFQNRNRIKTAQGWQWLTVPVTYRYPQKIRQVAVNPAVNWQRKHLEALRTHYRKAPFFEAYIGKFEQFNQQPFTRLTEVNISCIRLLMALLGLDRELVLASSLQVESLDPTLRLVEICRAMRADTYLSGRDGAKYMDLTMFSNGDIQVVFQNFRHPEYCQAYGSFQPNLSVIDLLFNCGPESLNILRSKLQ